MDKQPNVFAAAKVAHDALKLERYLKGERIFPTTMEMDLTQKCTRACKACPYSASRRPGHTLTLAFLDRLFGVLEGETPGLVLSGGEATTHPEFPEILKLARRRQFKEVAVISNGGMTHMPDIQEAMLTYLTSIRFSLYDWDQEDDSYFYTTLKKISDLRTLIENTGSQLEIGASILTRKKTIGLYHRVAMAALEAGIHWLYFHPFCIDWEGSHPRQEDQTGVLEAIRKLKKQAPGDANIHVPEERYSPEPFYFEKLHGSHFLIQVGADGRNYAGPECKYEEDYMLLDLNEYLRDDFLWHPRRMRGIAQINSDNYRYSGTKHRPPMFSHYIQGIMDQQSAREATGIQQTIECSYPNII